MRNDTAVVFALAAKQKIRCTVKFNDTHKGEEQSAAEFGVLCTIFSRLVRPSKLGATFVSAFLEVTKAKSSRRQSRTQLSNRLLRNCGTVEVT